MLHQLRQSHGAHRNGNAPTKEGTRAVWTNSCNQEQKGTLTGRNNMYEEATVTETERQRVCAQIPNVHAQGSNLSLRRSAFCPPKSSPCYITTRTAYAKRKAIDNNLSIIDGRWSILKRHHHQILEKHHQGLDHYGMKLECHSVLVRSYPCYFARRRAFYYGRGRTGCTASRDRQGETQLKRRGGLRQHPRDMSIGDKATAQRVWIFTYTERNPSRISEEENRAIKIPNDMC